MSLSEISLKEAVRFVVDNRGKSAPTEPAGIKLIATKCISNQNLYPTNETLRYVSEETYRNWFRAHPEPGDIILTNKGSQNGAVCLVPDPVDFCIAQDMVALRANEAVVDPLYLFAALRSSIVQQRMRNLNVDAVIPHFKKTDFDKLFFPLWDRGTQTSIGRLHFDLVYKIELNRRMNETLEAMARALFKDWFVDFGPTRAKAEGRAPYLAPEIWDLFPDALDDEDKPVGWARVPLSDFMDFRGGSQPPAKDFVSEARHGYVRLLQIRDFYSDSHTTFVPDQRRLRLVESDDICIGRYGSGSGDEKDSLGRLCRGLSGAINVALVRVEPKFECREWLATYIGAGLFRRDISGGSARAVQAGFRKEDLNHIKIARASDQVHAEFEKFGELVWQSKKQRQAESSFLARTRDLLLPKLMSGEIRLRDAEKAVEAVA